MLDSKQRRGTHLERVRHSGHLVYVEQNDWMPRVRIILENSPANGGPMRPFDPVDRVGHLKEGPETPLERVLDDFARLRRESLAALKAINLQPQDMSRQGTHPALGALTLSELLATWTVHDLTHLHQLSRVMAHRYGEAVGPRSAFLGVLNCRRER